MSEPPRSNVRTRVVHAGVTDVGRQRKHNEDCVLLRPEHGLFCVADGMGGHNAGDVASKLVTTSLGNFFEATAQAPANFDLPDDYAKLVPEARRIAAGVRKANHDVFTISNTHAQHHGMGSTCVAIHLTPGMVHIAHVGDSRCYRIRDGEIEQMTRDHSLINDALDMKPDLTKEELARLPKNIITRALGMKDVVKVDVKSEPVLPGDTFLLCSDGLTGMVPVHQILEVVGLTAEPQEACELLIAEANDAGGTDNISAVIVRVEEELATPELDADVEAHADLVEDEEEVIAADADVEELAADAAHFTEEDPATRPFQVEPSSGERPRAPDPWADGPTSLPWGAAEPLDGEHADGEDEPATRPFQITDDESVPELSAEPVVDDLVAAEMAAALAEGGEIDLDLRGPWPGKLPTLRCASCRHELFPGNRFCVECGSPIQSVTV